MHTLPVDYVERVYAGWLGKIIGVRYGAPIEGWTYQRIADTLGELDGYIVDYRDFAADDDSNGPLFFLRTLKDYTADPSVTAEQMGMSWLNYAPYEHGFYWWGGYGKSTEHTAYLNLRNGIMAPRSGSIAQNGAAIAEQIGGQIFIDSWGLTVAANPALAAQYARKAASVSHDGDGVYGGMFVAAAISAAFVERDILAVIQAGLSVIPEGCGYARMARDVRDYCLAHLEQDWRVGFAYVQEHYGYDKYPGNCHIIPNAAAMVVALVYGRGDFDRTLNICNMCGWDTDCNVANVGSIVGVLVGLEGIDSAKWRAPINDFLACSSVMGSMNILDIPASVFFMASLGYEIAGQEPPERWRPYLDEDHLHLHFELPGSTHGMRFASDSRACQARLSHAADQAHSGQGSLAAAVLGLPGGEHARIFHKTYYTPEDFYDSRYDPSFSPILYPGMTVSLFAKAAHGAPLARAYVATRSGERLYGDAARLGGAWQRLELTIPAGGSDTIIEAGLDVWSAEGGEMRLYIDDIAFTGAPSYRIDFERERIERWGGLHEEVSQVSYLKGVWTLEGGQLSGSTCDFGEAYTGLREMGDYALTAQIIPQVGGWHGINLRVQGAIRSYALVLTPGRVDLMKNDNGYRPLAGMAFDWQCGRAYTFTVEARGERFAVYAGERLLFTCADEDHPWRYGAVGASLGAGSHCHYGFFEIKPL